MMKERGIYARGMREKLWRSNRGGGLPSHTAVLRTGGAAEAPTGREEKKRELGVEKKKNGDQRKN